MMIDAEILWTETCPETGAIKGTIDTVAIDGEQAVRYDEDEVIRLAGEELGRLYGREPPPADMWKVSNMDWILEALTYSGREQFPRT